MACPSFGSSSEVTLWYAADADIVVNSLGVATQHRENTSGGQATAGAGFKTKCFEVEAGSTTLIEVSS